MAHQRAIDRVVDALRMHNTDPRAGAQGYSARCPAHDDRSPSLSVREGSDGRVLVRCHAGCTPLEVVEAIGLGMRDLFPDDTAAAGSRPGGPGKPRTRSAGAPGPGEGEGFVRLESAIHVYEQRLGTHDHRWDYLDAQGNHVGVVLRWDTEGGKEIRPVSLIDGRWRLTGMPEPRPLYWLPAILMHQPPLISTDPMIVCEGEKAADAAIACGYYATTSPHGANSASKADWSVLRDRDVIIIPDLDDAGEAYAREVASLCADADRVRVLDLRDAWPGLGAGDDLADAMALEGGEYRVVRAKLDALIEGAGKEQEGKEQEREEQEGALEIGDEPTSGYRPFPVELLPEPVRSYVIEGADSIGCDPSYIALPVLSMLAGAIGNTHAVRLKDGWDEPCVVWSCIVGRSGTAKSPAIELAFRPLDAIQESMFLEHRALLEATGDSLSPVALSARRCLIDDVTIEATLQLIQENPHGLVQRRDELAGWFDFERYSAGRGVGSSSRWIELFHARPVSVDRRTKESIFVPRASLSIAGGIQPGTLSRVFDRGNLESGLVARFLFAMPDPRPKRWTDATIPDTTLGAMRGLVEGLHAHEMCTVPPDASEERPRPHVIPLSPEARDAFAEFADAHGASMLHEREDIAAAWTKLECYVPRLALIFHLVREHQGDPTLIDPEAIDTGSITPAIGLVAWFKQETKRLYAAMLLSEQDHEIEQLVGWIRARGGRVSRRDIMRGPKRYRQLDKAQGAIDLLVERGLGTLRRQEGDPLPLLVLHDEHP